MDPRPTRCLKRMVRPFDAAYSGKIIVSDQTSEGLPQTIRTKDEFTIIETSTDFCL